MSAPVLQNGLIQSGRPVVVCDADEVLLRFLADLEAFMPSRGVYLDLQGYALTGAIKRSDDGVALAQADVSLLLKAFYAERGAELTPVEGAAEALARLSERAQIVVLSNVAPEIAAARRENLRRAGMDYPVIANAGLKGEMVRLLADEAGAPAAFIDDIAHHHASVAESAPETHRVHFIADPRLFRLASPSRHAALFTSDWAEAAADIERALARPQA